VGEGSGATAAWSKYATREAMGIAARRRAATLAEAVLSAKSLAMARRSRAKRPSVPDVTRGKCELYWGSQLFVLSHA
jgi:hypothetical protein